MLKVQELTKSFGEIKALDAVTFSIDPGEVVGLLGANGAGKTTIIRSICSLLDCDSGEIYFENKNIRNSSKYLKHVGAVLEGSRNVHWRLTALQNAKYFTTIHGGKWKDCKEVAHKLVNSLGLDEYQNLDVGKMSTGNRQKAALVSALAHQPRLLLLDEPTLGLDVATVEKMREFIFEQATNKNNCLLVTSHDLQFIGRVCSRVIVIDRGAVIYDGGMDDFRNRLHKYELVLESESELAADELEFLKKAISENSTVTKYADNKFVAQYSDPTTGMEITAEASRLRIKPTSLELREQSLEKSYVQLIGDHS